ncbi:uncharacterized protein LOC6585409 [Drosophila mojavensis]|uniref:Transmembrane protein n=1 Tax=Drosophila mojavensis TaxID=7230 RepID=B4L686_DROMO|nr:uncharacterized protein LOC6585409 [Drosophila mojavensis]EDW05882.1 uncharacterized protein Dmoj_GI16323 [Drosophila mojavensis]
MCEVQMLLEDLGHTFTKFKEQRRVEMLRLVGQVRCCECGHKMRMLEAQKSVYRFSMGRRKFLAICVLFLLLLAMMWIYMTRRYNQVAALGSGACVATYFFTHNGCDIYA